MRWLTILASLLAVAVGAARAQDQAPELPSAAPPSFEDWLVTLRQEARERGFSEEILDETLANIAPLEHVV